MSKDKQRHVAVYLQLLDVSSLRPTRSQGVYAIPRFFILNAEGQKVWSEGQAGYTAEEKRFVLSDQSATLFGYKRFISRKYLTLGGQRFLPEGKLILRCHLQIREGGRDVDQIPSVPSALTDFSQLLQKPSTGSGNGAEEASTFSDVVFRVDGAEFRCHKAIVGQKSSVLKNLFLAYDNEAFEISTDQPYDLELQSSVFRDALLHIYGNTPRILTIPFERFNRVWSANIKKLVSLMLLADKYQLKDLPQLCEAKLIELFRTRSQESSKNLKRKEKRSGKKSQTDFFHFDDKPITLAKMTHIAEHVTASGLARYLASCQDLRSKS